MELHPYDKHRQKNTDLSKGSVLQKRERMKSTINVRVNYRFDFDLDNSHEISVICE